MQKLDELYRGKTKTLYNTDDPLLLILEFRNDISALNGQRIDKFCRKGMINNQFNYFIMSKLEKFGVLTQIEKLLSQSETLVKKLDMFPIECVIRNRAAGSFVKRFGIKEGFYLNPPIFELFLKNDCQNDPMINTSYCKTFKLVKKKYLSQIQKLTYQINEFLCNFFLKSDLILVDFKVEFGLYDNKIILGDEFSLDSARLWDRSTLDKMDKDIYRQNRLGLIEAYEAVLKRLDIQLT
ncbi:phosphoribosylaminoimidazolesuccinocarboxamide synthase [Candidatus Erwinia haradaeae]|uniref:Phosphoribosylaminoimidazole-succinocarboxamide synthase n=1 Tax=Candidatus Erwinia haradaeae TaxID=1922217 RepID=A0A451D1L5_9GAMM|nr:phosphoribosylaminoimidazolesuccinocarboxamide synthase [Candidatus Erwinia haradaeae]VFP79504.1 Phosphoribosylaminoimidazole-succinocarboxamide synthase [Candidatus Erwinia haradaeae]